MSLKREAIDSVDDLRPEKQQHTLNDIMNMPSSYVPDSETIERLQSSTTIDQNEKEFLHTYMKYDEQPLADKVLAAIRNGLPWSDVVSPIYEKPLRYINRKEKRALVASTHYKEFIRHIDAGTDPLVAASVANWAHNNNEVIFDPLLPPASQQTFFNDKWALLINCLTNKYIFIPITICNTSHYTSSHSMSTSAESATRGHSPSHSSPSQSSAS